MGIYYISLGHLLHFTWAIWMSAVSGVLEGDALPTLQGFIGACGQLICLRSGWQDRSMWCHTAISHRVLFMSYTHAYHCGLSNHVNIALPQPSYCLYCFSAEDMSQGCSPLSFWTFLPGSLPSFTLLALFTPPFYVVVPKKAGQGWSSSQSQNLTLFRQRNMSPRCTREPYLLNNISSWPFKTQSNLALHTAYFLNWKASESRTSAQNMQI